MLIILINLTLLILKIQGNKMQFNEQSIEEKSINTIRLLSVDAIQKANSGHPGMPMGCAPIAYLLYKKKLKHNPKNPSWFGRDRFVLSGGHGSMLLYSILHLSGYGVSLEDIKNFRQWGSITPGHPEFGLTPGVETTTGPLGQGFANAVGMAIASKFLSAKFNKPNFEILSNTIYAIAGDGDFMEGITQEAASFAGNNGLNNLIVFYDYNHITIEGNTSLAYSDDVQKRFESLNWNVLVVEDVNNLGELDTAVNSAQNESSKPTLIITNTTIGFGSPNKSNTAGIHGSPLGDEEIKLTKENLGWDTDKKFFVPDEVYSHFSTVAEKGAKLEQGWNELFEQYKNEYPNEAELFINGMNGEFGDGWKSDLPTFENYNEALATRSASGKVINAIKDYLPTMIGGSADLAPSTNTLMQSEDSFSKENYSGRNFHFGIREHAMAGILNGVEYFGGVISYGATFLVFSDYLRPSIRLASISKLRPIYVFTHDSIGLGEDGPTHQPIEHFAALRSIPGLIVIRPADANETVYAWRTALETKGQPVAILLTRQKLHILDRTKYADAENLGKGAYIIRECNDTPDVILMATGSEVELAIEAAEKMENENVRVVSFPSWELFEKQSAEYKNFVLPKNIKNRISIEAGISMGWEKYVGENGISISIDGKYGASAPAKTLFEQYGFTVENIIAKAEEMFM